MKVVRERITRIAQGFRPNETSLVDYRIVATKGGEGNDEAKDPAVRKKKKKMSHRNRFNERNEIVSNERRFEALLFVLLHFFSFFFFFATHLRSVLAPFDNEFRPFPLCEETSSSSSSLVLPPPSSLGRDIA